MDLSKNPYLKIICVIVEKHAKVLVIAQSLSKFADSFESLVEYKMPISYEPNWFSRLLKAREVKD